MLKQFFNYYIVLKACWIILLFQLIGFLALVVLEQGKDILQAFSFFGEDLVVFHTWSVLFAACWWSWQSWRAARVILHFTTFDFINFNSRYALRAQVLIPRILGMVPLLMLAYGIALVTNAKNPLIYINVCLAIWLYIFYHLRKDIIVLFLSRNKLKFLNIPDYVQVKNDAYPATFIWLKQGRWIVFRLITIFLFFTAVVLSPVRIPQFLGAGTIILFALGSWLMLATFLDYTEKRVRFPFTFTLIVMVIGFSFFNNNHAIRTLKKAPDTRLTIEQHFDQWYAKRAQQKDTVPVFLVASQGGGVRSAYWAAQVLSEVHENSPKFDDYTYAYSTVSGGSLGVATYKGLVQSQSHDLTNDAHNILSKDFLAPVSSWLVVPDLVQKFLPLPVNRLDRAKALEYSWENAAAINGQSFLAPGFLETYQNDDCIYMFNATRVENGFRALLSNVKIGKGIFSLSEDVFDVTHTDMPISTAIGVSARFPFITPPALVYDKDGKHWGNLLDGGYVENMGATTMLELYHYLRKLSKSKGYKVKFNLLFIKNTKVEYTTKISGLHEVLGPLNTFNKVWVNSGYYDENNSELSNLNPADRALFINLDRPDDKIIPLGWYLSAKATTEMQNQVPYQTQELQDELTRLFE